MSTAVRNLRNYFINTKARGEPTDHPKVKSRIWKVICNLPKNVIRTKDQDINSKKLRFCKKRGNDIHYISRRSDYKIEDIEALWWDKYDYEYFRETYAVKMNGIDSGMIVPRSPPPAFDFKRIRSDSFGHVSKPSPLFFCPLLSNETTKIVQAETFKPLMQNASTEDQSYEDDLRILKSISKDDVISSDFSDLELVEAARVDEESPEWLELLKYDCRTLNFPCYDFEAPYCGSSFTDFAATEGISDIGSPHAEA